MKKTELNVQREIDDFANNLVARIKQQVLRHVGEHLGMPLERPKRKNKSKALAKPKQKRKPMSEEQKALLSKKMKAVWRKRKQAM